MNDSIPTRGILLVVFVLLGLVVISLSEFATQFETILYTGYGLAVPFMFLLMVIGGIYFGIRHLLTA